MSASGHGGTRARARAKVCAVAAAGLWAALTTAFGAQSPRGTLQPCPSGSRALECGSIVVPEDRGAQGGRWIEIHFRVARREAPGAAEDAVFLLPGGPGQSGAALSPFVDGWLKPLRANHDLVFIDQRGTGQSHPLACPSGAADHPERVFGHVFNPQLIRTCARLLSRDADLTKYTTDDAVDDVDAVRAVLGYERISLYGGSYGSRMAQAYMRRFPARVRSAVLDAVVPFDLPVPLTYAANAQRSLELVWRACAASEACHANHPDPAREFDTALHLFDRGPIKTSLSVNGTSISVQMSRGDFAYAVRGVLYNPGIVSRLTDEIGRAASTGDVSPLATRLWTRQRGMDADIAFGMHLSVLCAEDLPAVDEAAIMRETAGTFLGRYLIDEYVNACRVWPRGRVAADFHTPISVAVPTLLVSGAFDPSAPQSFAERVVRTLPVAALVTAPTGSHTSATGCPKPAVLYLLDHGTLDGMPAVCESSK